MTGSRAWVYLVGFAFRHLVEFAIVTSLFGHATILLGSEPLDKLAKPKGVVLVLIDDIGYGDINLLEPSDLKTPHLDDLGRQSLRLTDFHVGTTCSPTRASLLTGRFINATGVWHTIAGRSMLRENEQTIADVFKANGWRTGVFGKWHLGEGYPFAPRFRGFDTTDIHGGGGVGQQPDYWQNDYYAANEETRNHAGDPTSNDHYFNNGEVKEADQFCTDYWFSNAFSFIEDALEEDMPFFCYIPTNAAHGPFNAPPDGKAGFDGLIENIDQNMGRLNEFLKNRGILDDVLVVFMTDNGTAGRTRMGGLRGKKGSHYDGGHNVPCFVRWRNGGMAGTLASARDINSITAAADLFPTFVDLFGLNQPSGGQTIHGISLKPLLLNETHVPESRSWIVDTQRAEDLVKWKRLCVMKDEVVDGKIVNKWRLTRENKDSAFELHDWQQDRAQETNLLDQQAIVAKEMIALYEDWWHEIDGQTREYPASVIGVEPESVLYSHDWINHGGAPWHQNHVLKGNSGSRISAVRFAESGKYTFELRRWPREDGGPIDGPDSNGRGTALKIVKATLAIEGVGSWSTPVKSGELRATFEININEGEDTTLETGFMDLNEQILTGAYYVYVRKNN